MTIHGEDLYFDHNASTPLLPAVRARLRLLCEENLANPSSTHRAGRRSRKLIEQARRQVADLLGADPGEVVFTSGGTEANHAAVHGLTGCLPDSAHLIVSATAHSSLLEAVRQQESLGHPVSVLTPDTHGVVSVNQVLEALRPDTGLVSLLSANNETGVQQAVAELAEPLASQGVLLHVDAVQSVGKEMLDLRTQHFTSLVLSGHKLGAPAGVGALWVREGTRFRSLWRGGHQERQRRAGTENLFGIVLLGVAAAEAELRRGDWDRVQVLRDELEEQLCEALPGTVVNGHPAPRLPNTSNLAFVGLDGGELLRRLSTRGLHAAAGSACRAGAEEPSHVLRAMGLAASRVQGSVRFSLGRETSRKDVQAAVRLITETVRELVAGSFP